MTRPATSQLQVTEMNLYTFPSVRGRYTLLFAFMILTVVSYFTFVFVTVRHISVSQSQMQPHKMFIRENNRCREQRNFVFIKQMKCATSSLLSMFYRFGYQRNLSFVSPMSQKIYLNWPYPLTKLDFRPSSSGYNILTDHSIYTEDVMESIMPQDTVYLSIIRHPFAHAMSVFQYFKVGTVSGVPNNVGNRFEEYLRHIDKYDTKYKKGSSKLRTCIPRDFSMTKNLMSHCFGMPLGFPSGTSDISNDLGQVQRYIRYIDKKFSLVMIVEYFFESLVLLRRLMCWKISDIVFFTANVGKYSFSRENVSSRLRGVHQNWSSVDYELYDYFNKTLWTKVSEQSSDFFQEVAAVKSIHERTEKYCRYIHHLGARPPYRYPSSAQSLTVTATQWSSQFTITTDDCWLLGPDPYRVMRAVQTENSYKEAALLKERTKVKDTRKHKGIC